MDVAQEMITITMNITKENMTISLTRKAIYPDNTASLRYHDMTRHAPASKVRGDMPVEVTKEKEI
jgi:hypothetical protein